MGIAAVPVLDFKPDDTQRYAAGWAAIRVRRVRMDRASRFGR